MVAVFPALPGQSWSIDRQFKFATRVQRSVSGRTLRLLDQPVPIWTWTLTFSVLRDGMVSGTLYAELRTLIGFLLSLQGQFTPFLYSDPSDNTIAGQVIGIGDGTTAVFQLVRTMTGGAGLPLFTEPILAPNNVTAVYLSRGPEPPQPQAKGAWSVDPTTGLLTFNTAPPSGQQITADFTYYFRCCLADDAVDLSEFMFRLWELKKLQFESILL